MNKKSFFGGLAIGLAGILAVGAVGWFTKGFREWKKEKPVIDNPIEDSTTSDEAGAYDENGNNLADGNIHAMPMRLTFTGAKSLASNTSNDVTTNEDGTKSVTVQAMTNQNVSIDVDWSLKYDNEMSVTEDVMTVIPESDGSMIATITMYKYFTSHIILTCSSRLFPNIKATCTVDCVSDTVTRSSSYVNGNVGSDGFIEGAKVDVTIPKTGSTALRFDPRFYTKGSADVVSHFEKITYSVNFYNLAAADGFGFNNVIGAGETADLVSECPGGNFYYHGKNEFVIDFSVDTLKALFEYDESQGFTADSFYTYGISMLKGNKDYFFVTLTTTIKVKDEYGGATKDFVYYAKVSTANLEDLSITINGGNILF